MKSEEDRMKRSLELAEKLIRQSYLEKNEYIELLSAYKDEEIVICLRKEADRLRQKYYGNKVYMRGLIEFTNFCKNNCYYWVSVGTIKMPAVTVSQKKRF